MDFAFRMKEDYEAYRNDVGHREELDELFAEFVSDPDNLKAPTTRMVEAEKQVRKTVCFFFQRFYSL